ncbi:MAG: hypothetical protein LBI55_00285 [Oscillospiraceae bacterium]|jgi:outer membrane murein-binding lipoprotein Lpp|nr:hypothetical protein [Oscillospiraceae bacterium]
MNRMSKKANDSDLHRLLGKYGIVLCFSMIVIVSNFAANNFFVGNNNSTLKVWAGKHGTSKQGKLNELARVNQTSVMALVSKINRLKEQRDFLREEVQSNKETTNALRSKIADFEGQIAALREEKEELNKKNQKISGNLKLKNTTLGGQNTVLQEKMKELKALNQKTIDELKNQIIALREEKEELNKKNQKISGNLKLKNTTLKEQNTQSSKTLQGADSAIERKDIAIQCDTHSNKNGSLSKFSLVNSRDDQYYSSFYEYSSDNNDYSKKTNTQSPYSRNGSLGKKKSKKKCYKSSKKAAPRKPGNGQTSLTLIIKPSSLNFDFNNWCKMEKSRCVLSKYDCIPYNYDPKECQANFNREKIKIVFEGVKPESLRKNDQRLKVLLFNEFAV